MLSVLLRTSECTQRQQRLKRNENNGGPSYLAMHLSRSGWALCCQRTLNCLFHLTDRITSGWSGAYRKFCSRVSTWAGGRERVANINMPSKGAKPWGRAAELDAGAWKWGIRRGMCWANPPLCGSPQVFSDLKEYKGILPPRENQNTVRALSNAVAECHFCLYIRTSDGRPCCGLLHPWQLNIFIWQISNQQRWPTRNS